MQSLDTPLICFLTRWKWFSGWIEGVKVGHFIISLIRAGRVGKPRIFEPL